MLNPWFEKILFLVGMVISLLFGCRRTGKDEGGRMKDERGMGNGKRCGAGFVD